MGIGEPTEWSLYIDESGAFTPEEPGHIVGLLLQDGLWAKAGIDLRSRLRAVSPIVPHPLHARDLNVPSFHLVSYLSATPEQRTAHWAAQDLDAYASAIAKGSPALLNARDNAVALLRKPGAYQALVAFDHLVRRESPDVFDRLKKIVFDSQRRMTELLGEIQLRLGRDRCAVIGAAGTRRLEVDEEGGRDRYLQLLPVLFERLFLLLGGASGERHRVKVWAANRPLRRPDGARAMVGLAEVSAAITEAESLVWHPPAADASRSVEVTTVETPAYDAKVVPELVLADYISNGLFVPMSTSRRWVDLQVQSDRAVRIPTRLAPRGLGPRRLPTLAGDGLTRVAIASAVAGKPGPSVREAQPGWSADQAEEWVFALRDAPPRRGTP